MVTLLEDIREEKLLSWTQHSDQQKNQTDPLNEYSVILPTETRWLQAAVLCLPGSNTTLAYFEQPSYTTGNLSVHM